MLQSDWRGLDGLPARDWLIDNIGKEAYNVIWHPLLRVKFGDHYDKISAAWLWHRIVRVARSRNPWWGRSMFGYLTHGSETIVRALDKCLAAQPNVSLNWGLGSFQWMFRTTPSAASGSRTEPSSAAL